jgi:hypothetical protein
VLTVTGASGVIGQESGWMYAEVDYSKFTGIGTNDIIISIYSSDSNRIMYSYAGALSPKRLFAFIRSNNVNLDFTGNINLELGLNKFLFIYGNNIRQHYANGVLVSASTSSFTPPSTNSIRFARNNGTQPLDDPIFRTAIGIGTLTEQEAIEITTL